MDSHTMTRWIIPLTLAIHVICRAVSASIHAFNLSYFTFPCLKLAMGIFHEVISRHERESSAAQEEAIMVLAHLFCQVSMQPGWAKKLKEKANHEGECIVILPELPAFAQEVVNAYQADVSLWRDGKYATS